MKRVVRVVVGAALMALVAVPAAAQNSELGIGFARQNQSWNGCCANGITVDFARAISSTETRSIAIVADFSLTKFSDDTGFEETNIPILGGIRFKFLRNKRASLFVQATAGVMPWSDNDPDDGTDFVVGGGGGVQVRLTDMVDVKAQLDFYGDRSSGTWYDYSRLLFAAVFKFGAR